MYARFLVVGAILVGTLALSYKLFHKGDID
jgi:hypothetical protein